MAAMLCHIPWPATSFLTCSPNSHVTQSSPPYWPPPYANHVAPKAAALFDRAIQRGELPADTDVDIAMDLLAGPLYWRLAVMQVEVSDEYCEKLAHLIVAALTA